MRWITALLVAVALLAACSDDTSSSGDDVVDSDTLSTGQDTVAPTDTGPGDTTTPSDTTTPQDTFVPSDTTTPQDTVTVQDTTVGDTLPTDVGPGSSPVGGTCSTAADCAGTSTECFASADGFPGGYCVVGGCSAGTCPSGSSCWQLQDESTVCLPDCADLNDCRSGYLCDQDNVCWPGDACTANSCPSGEVCGAQGLCEPAPCTLGSCDTGFVCSNGVCIVDLGTVPSGTPPASCPNAPAPECTGTAAYCGQLVAFEPVTGTGYWNYPLNGETTSNQYRSYIRRDTMMMIKYAAAMVDCVAAGWAGNGGLLGLGDMSEANGAIPGTSVNDPGHPPGTHVDGLDMDIAYYLNTGYPNDFWSANPCPTGQHCNLLQPICQHSTSGQEQYHCVGEAYLLDVWRTALFIAFMHDVLVKQSDGKYYFQLRVIGVDGKAGPLIDAAIDALCTANWYDGNACNPSYRALTYEVTDQGYGWYYFHHHHFHVSTNGLIGSPFVDNNRCMLPGCASVDPFSDPRRFLYKATNRTKIERRYLELKTE